ncbi:MAG: dTDP-4-dehydrorhamnose 3,5-epimerase family protein [Imperialibacter sp.]|uniref:dTDP-4-dehydrorhamnose 3,5-epimerase family protein n=1 Tax=Imperialibacter sp. TaxID=2038411 RepID=UPI0032EC081F
MDPIVNAIDGVLLTPLKVIETDKGAVYHAMKNTDHGFSSFGEAYFSHVTTGVVKGWKKHTRMTLNIVVPVGEIKFVMYDDRNGSSTNGKFHSLTLSLDNYQRLTVPPGIWMAFQGVGPDKNLLLNLASIPHDPDEAVNLVLEQAHFKYSW